MYFLVNAELKFLKKKEGREGEREVERKKKRKEKKSLGEIVFLQGLWLMT